MFEFIERNTIGNIYRREYKTIIVCIYPSKKIQYGILNNMTPRPIKEIKKNLKEIEQFYKLCIQLEALGGNL